MKRTSIRILALLLVVTGAARAQESAPKAPLIPVEEYGARRAGLQKAFPETLLLIEADPLFEGMDDIDKNIYVYDFFYLTGYHQVEDILAIDPDSGPVLFTLGKPEKLKESTGIADVRGRGEFPEYVKKAFAKVPKASTRLRDKAKKIVDALATGAPVKVSAAGAGIQRAITKLRLIKSPAELEMLKKAAAATNQAHLAAMKVCRPGINEKLLQNTIEDKFKKEGCDGLGFPSIVGSGKNGTILHYCENKDLVPPASLVVCDIGASYRGYVTDITRTLPTSGKFTEVHKKAYQCVLDAQKAAEALLKPGATWGELSKAAAAVFEERGLTEFASTHNRWPRGHSLGHQVGLAVHDPDLGQKFEEGMVITIEPGYYNWKDGWGIRIEDIYIVTKDGSERMSSLPPREVDELEAFMAGKKKEF